MDHVSIGGEFMFCGVVRHVVDSGVGWCWFTIYVDVQFLCRRVSCRSRKLIVLSSSCVGVKFRFG